MQPARLFGEAKHEALEQLARELLESGGELPLPADRESPGNSEPRSLQKLTPAYVLQLDEIVSDGNGEVVLLNDARLTMMAIATDAGVVQQGTAAEHATVDGENVGGFAYVTFTNGLTMYYPEGVDLAVVPQV